jgi:hypothetical protein
MSDVNDTLRIAARAVQLYAETHPRPTQVTQTQAATMLGVHPKTIRNYIAAGKLALNGCGLIPIGAVDALLAPQNLRKVS